jgi:hypothetical protein
VARGLDAPVIANRLHEKGYIKGQAAEVVPNISVLFSVPDGGTFRWLAPVTRLIMSDRFRTRGTETSVGILGPYVRKPPRNASTGKKTEK